MKRPAPPKRRREFRRSREIARGSGPRPAPMRRKPRRPSETIRAHGEPEFREWMKRQPCVVCGRTPSDAAHLTNGGKGRKDDVARTVPLCSDYPDCGCLKLGHHSEYDGGKRSFRAKYAHLDLPALAAETQRRWLECAA